MSRSGHSGTNAKSKGGEGGGQQTLPQRQQDSESIVARERLPADRGSDQVLNGSKSAND